MPRRIPPDLTDLSPNENREHESPDLSEAREGWTDPERKMLSREERDLLAVLRKGR